MVVRMIIEQAIMGTRVFEEPTRIDPLLFDSAQVRLSPGVRANPLLVKEFDEEIGDGASNAVERVSDEPA